MSAAAATATQIPRQRVAWSCLTCQSAGTVIIHADCSEAELYAAVAKDHARTWAYPIAFASVEPEGANRAVEIGHVM